MESLRRTKNRYIYPVEMRTNVIMTYDESPMHKIDKWKYAVDFIIPEGTLIRAAHDGVVIAVKQDSDIGGPDMSYDPFGNYIEIEHPNDEFSIYEHLRKNGSLVSIGEKVVKDQPIGYSGKTGMIAHLGSHLHFDVHRYISEGPEDYETLEIQWESD